MFILNRIMAKQNINWIVWSGILGILFFLILLGVLNIISENVANPVFQEIVGFLNQNILLILLISVLLLFGNIFEIFIFPFNIFYPLFNAVGGVLWVEFIFRILKLVSLLIEQDIYAIFAPFYFLAIMLVLIIILIVGYVHVFSRIIPRRKIPRVIIKPRRQESNIEWKDVGNEFKGAAYNLASTLKDSLEPKKKTGKKKGTKKED